MRFPGRAASVALVALASLGTGCSVLPRISLAPEPAPPMPSDALDRPKLQARLIELADQASAEIGDAARVALAAHPAADVRFEIQSIRVDVASYTALLATDASPESGLVDLYVYLSLRRWVSDRWLDARPLEAPERAIGAALASLEGEVRDLATEVLRTEQLRRIDELVEGWKTEHPNATTVGLVRLGDFTQLRATAFNAAEEKTLEPSLFEPVTEAQRESERTRLLGERLTYTLNRLPYLVRWQSEELLYRALDQPELARTLDLLGQGREAVDRLAVNIDAARQTTDDVRREVASLAEQVDRGDLEAARQLAVDVRTAITDARAALPEADRTIGELREAIAGAERVTGALKDLTHGPDGKPVDLSAVGAASERFAVAAADLKQAIGKADAILSSDEATRRLEEIGRTGKAGVDHLVWRIGQLLVIAASLTVVLRITWILTRRNEPAPRPVRRGAP